MDKPEALMLADIVERNSMFNETAREAAAELRRLHAENETLREANEAFGKRQEWWNDKMVDLEAQREALLEALKKIAADHAYFSGDTLSYARAAIAKAEGEQT